MAQAIPAIIALVGAGVSYYSQYQATKSADQFAVLNAQGQLEAARAQGRSQQMQAQIQAAQAAYEQRAAQNQAKAIESQAEAQSQVAQQNIRKTREDFRHKLGALRAADGGGVLDTTGSPLDYLVAAAEDEQQLEAEMRWEDEVSRVGAYNQAASVRAQGSMAGINAGLYTLQGYAAVANAKREASQANLNLLGEKGRNKAARTAALGQFIGSAAGAAGSYFKTSGTSTY